MDYQEVQTRVFATVVGLVKRNGGGGLTSAIGLNTTLGGLDCDSFDAVELTLDLEESFGEYGLKVPETQFCSLNERDRHKGITLRQIVDYIHKTLKEAS